MTMKTYGHIIPNLTIEGKPAPYGVVNERGIRAAAGIMFLLGIIAFFPAFLTGDYTLIRIVSALFALDFFLKTVFQPKYSIFGFVGELLVKKQKSEYVGAIQKRFAWSLGLVLAGSMVIVLATGNQGLPSLTICLICLTFMWMETALGICVGCKIYGALLGKGIIKTPEHKPACPGGVCSIKKPHC